MLARCRKCIILWERWYIWILNLLQLLRSFEMIEKFPRGHENYSNSIHRCATGAVDIAFRSHFLLSWSSCELWTPRRTDKKFQKKRTGNQSGPHRHPILCKSRWFYDFMCLVIIIGNIELECATTQQVDGVSGKKQPTQKIYMHETWVSGREEKVSWLLRETSDEEEKKKTHKKQHKLDVTKRWQAWRDFYITHVPAILWTE